jgi:hypothetical protein
VGQPRLEVGRQVVVGHVRVHEGGGAEHLTIPARHLHGEQDVHEADRRVVGHVGVPVLPGVGQPDRPAVLDDVGQDVDLRHTRLVKAGEHVLDRAEAAREVPERGGVEMLRRKPQHAISPEGAQDCREVGVAEWLGDIDPTDRRAEDLSGRLDGQHQLRLCDHGPAASIADSNAAAALPALGTTSLRRGFGDQP